MRDSFLSPSLGHSSGDSCEAACENPREFPPCFRTLPALLVEEEMLGFTCPAGVALVVVQTGDSAVARRLVRAVNAGFRLTVVRPLMVAAFTIEADRCFLRCVGAACT